MPKWCKCKTDACQAPCAVCRACYKTDPNACEEHTKKQTTIGICTKCDAQFIKRLTCFGAKKLPSSGGCDAKNTECMQCTSFKSAINSNFAIYCHEVPLQRF